MITDKDVKKLKEVFATRDDLKTFATKDDLKAFATKDDLKEINNKIDKLDHRIDRLDHRIENGIESLAKDIITVIEMVGDTNQKLDKKTADHDDILENHERRLDKVEDKVFTTT